MKKDIGEMVWRSLGEVLGEVVEQASEELEKRNSKLQRTSLKTKKIKDRIDASIWGTTPLCAFTAQTDTGAAE